MESTDTIVGHAIEHLQGAAAKIKAGNLAWAAYDLGSVQAQLFELMKLICEQTKAA